MTFKSSVILLSLISRSLLALAREKHDEVAKKFAIMHNEEMIAKKKVIFIFLKTVKLKTDTPDIKEPKIQFVMKHSLLVTQTQLFGTTQCGYGECILLRQV